MADSDELKRAKSLLGHVSQAREPMSQRMLVAAAISTVMSRKPIVVGGTAEEYWTHDEYHPTDLDLIPEPSQADEEAFKRLGFTKEGRHWVHPEFAVATEFPHDESFEVRRTFDEIVEDVMVKVIGVDDLYLDRLGQSTATENVRDQHFASLFAVAVANWEQLDWKYISGRIRETVNANPLLGASMRKMHRLCLRLARNALATKRAETL